MKNVTNILLSVCIILMSITLLIIGISVFEYLPMDTGIVILVLSIVVFIIAVITGIALDYGAVEYECKKCGHRFKPTLWAYIFGAHIGTTKYLKCPHCGKNSFCKRRLSE